MQAAFHPLRPTCVPYMSKIIPFDKSLPGCGTKHSPVLPHCRQWKWFFLRGSDLKFNAANTWDSICQIHFLQSDSILPRWVAGLGTEAESLFVFVYLWVLFYVYVKIYTVFCNIKQLSPFVYTDMYAMLCHKLWSLIIITNKCGFPNCMALQ